MDIVSSGGLADPVLSRAVLVAGAAYGLMAMAGLIVAGIGIATAWARPPDGRRLTACLIDRPWTLREAWYVLAALLVGFGIGWGGRKALAILGWSGATADGAGVIVMGVGLYGAVLVAVAVLAFRRGWSWRQAFGSSALPPIRAVGVGAAWYVACLPAVLGVALAWLVLLVCVGYPVSQQDLLSVFAAPQSPVLRVGLLAIAVIAAPVAEELVFRGVLLPIIARRAGLVPAVALTAALFASIHLHLPSAAPLFVLAVGLAVAYVVTANLLVPIVMHALFNAVNLAVLVAMSSRP